MSNTKHLDTSHLNQDQRKVRNAELALANLCSAAKRFESLQFDNGETLAEINAAIMVARLDVSCAKAEEFMNRVTRERAARALDASPTPRPPPLRLRLMNLVDTNLNLI